MERIYTLANLTEFFMPNITIQDVDKDEISVWCVKHPTIHDTDDQFDDILQAFVDIACKCVETRPSLVVHIQLFKCDMYSYDYDVRIDLSFRVSVDPLRKSIEIKKDVHIPGSAPSTIYVYP